jgi:hypothetical protein
VRPRRERVVRHAQSPRIRVRLEPELRAQQ